MDSQNDTAGRATPVLNIRQQEEEEKYNHHSKTDNLAQDNESKDDSNTILVRRLYDRDQQVPKVVQNKEDPDHILNTVDKNWNYNITMGDMELRTITLYDGTKETLWFPMEEYPDQSDTLPLRKVFISLKVKRVSAVDNIAETFRMRFHIYFNWLPTEEDYKSLYKAQKESKETNDPQLLLEWEPRWYPHLDFQNMIEQHTNHWEIYPEEGRFRIQKFKDFAQRKGTKVTDGTFDCTEAAFIRAKLECEMTFAEELELQSFPFDCQDLSCIIHERTTTGVKAIFLPELRKPQFGSIDPRYSVIDEWDLETAVLEFGDADSRASRASTTYAMIVLRLKVKRRWKVFVISIWFLMACITTLALTAFSLGPEDLGSRLNLLITLILTAVAFSYVVFDALPNVPYLTFMDKYILSSYGFLVALMIETSMIRQEFMTHKIDRIIFWVSLGYLVLYNAGFGVYAYFLRQDEEGKLSMSSDEVEKEINLSRPALRFDYTKRMRSGLGGRLLSFIGYTVATDAMSDEQRAIIQAKQDKMDALYASQASKHGYTVSEAPDSPLMGKGK
eukprot:314368_1